jgi:tetratricopeptide (TPR) repeat protein
VALVGAFTKETISTLPLAIILCNFYFFKQQNIRYLKYAAAYFIIPLIVLALSSLQMPFTFSGIEKQLIETPKASSLTYLFTQFSVMLTYLRLLFVPVGQNLDYDYPLAKNILHPQSLIGLCLIVILLYAALKIRSKHKLASFAILLFFTALLPTSSVIPLLNVIFEHRLYISVVGFSIVLVSLLSRVFRKKYAALKICLSLILIAYSLLSYARNAVWRDAVTLWSDVIEKSPRKLRGYNERGIAYMENKDYLRAISDFSKAIDIDSNCALFYYNRALVYQRLGSYKEAITDYSRAIKIEPLNAQAYNNRGLVLFTINSYAAAMRDFKKAYELCPRCAIFSKNIEITYKKGREHYARMLKDNPDKTEFYNDQRDLLYLYTDYKKNKK